MDVKSVLARIKPSKEEALAVKRLANEVMKKIKVKGATVMLGGSGAKDTYLKGTHDIDIYVKFDPKKYGAKSDALADILHAAIKKKFPRLIRLHGSRDYFQVKQGSFTFEIVPILNITKASQAKNITDFSHLHVKYVQKYKRLADEIRLAKAFAKAQGVYGAESYIRGFSGYVIELLVISYGSFKKVVRGVAKWGHVKVIGSKKDAKKLNEAKKQSPLILIDPVQPDRNAAAAISEEKYYDFVLACKAFQKSPSLSFFERKRFDKEKLKSLGKVILVEAMPLSGKKDVVGAKVVGVFERVKSALLEHHFCVLFAKCVFGEEDQKACFYFVLDPRELASEKKQFGPPKENEKAVEAFRKKHGSIMFNEHRAYAMVKRNYTSASTLVKDLAKTSYVQEKVKSVKVVVY